jgi:hypothetical protein
MIRQLELELTVGTLAIANFNQAIREMSRYTHQVQIHD